MASPLSLDVGYLFGEFQCLPVDDCPAASFDSGALARESESTSFYLPSWGDHLYAEFKQTIGLECHFTNIYLQITSFMSKNEIQETLKVRMKTIMQ